MLSAQYMDRAYSTASRAHAGNYIGNHQIASCYLLVVHLKQRAKMEFHM